MNWEPYITAEPDTSHGKACSRETRVRVSVNLDNLAAELGKKEIIESYPYLNSHCIHAAIAYAAYLTR